MAKPLVDARGSETRLRVYGHLQNRDRQEADEQERFFSILPGNRRILAGRDEIEIISEGVAAIRKFNNQLRVVFK